MAEAYMDMAKRTRLRELRNREVDGGLTAAEAAELDRLLGEMDSEEASRLQPAMERLLAQHQLIDAENAALKELIRRQETLARRLQQVIAEARAESQAIDREAQRLLAAGPRS